MGLETKLSLKQTQKLLRTSRFCSHAYHAAVWHSRHDRHASAGDQVIADGALELVQAIRQGLLDNPLPEEKPRAAPSPSTAGNGPAKSGCRLAGRDRRHSEMG